MECVTGDCEYTPVVMTFKGDFLCQRCCSRWLVEDLDVQRDVPKFSSPATALQ